MSGAQPGDYFGDTWEYDGTDWTQLTPATSPTDRWGAELVWYSPLSRLLLFGGVGSGGDVGQNDAWTWNRATQTWDAFPTLAQPTFNHGQWTNTVYDDAHGHVMTHSNDRSTTYNETWLMEVIAAQGIYLNPRGID
jgi:hypothetical protein